MHLAFLKSLRTPVLPRGQANTTANTISFGMILIKAADDLVSCQLLYDGY